MRLRPPPVDKCGDNSRVEVRRRPAHKRDEREEAYPLDVLGVPLVVRHVIRRRAMRPNLEGTKPLHTYKIEHYAFSNTIESLEKQKQRSSTMVLLPYASPPSSMPGVHDHSNPQVATPSYIYIPNINKMCVVCGHCLNLYNKLQRIWEHIIHTSIQIYIQPSYTMQINNTLSFPIKYN